ncbi:MAG: ZIP family metal transporter [Proteobacteria bacterium]|nr:ZIP family metal transporter [Pseudomonadota bacterium]
MPLLPLILLCAAVGGIASAAFALALLWIPAERSVRMLPHFVSFATGALLGAALLALLPEAMESAGPAGARGVGAAILIGLGVFFVIEKLVLWWHSHEEAEDPGPGHGHAGHGHGHGHDHAHGPGGHPSGILVLVGDSIHNALDGVLIAAAFLKDPTLGLLTTCAVAAHEIPHRVGDFALLVHAGFSRRRALFLNLATGLASVIGALAAYLALGRALGALPYALAFAAAGFLYIAVAGLIPGLQRRADPRTSAIQVLLISSGIAAIALAERLTHP